MNVEASTKPETIAQVGAPEQLVAAREARGWSMSDVAAKLGMMPRQIEAIEQGRWEALPGHAFVRGAVRAYGKALQVDVAPLLATLGGHALVPELRPSSSLDSPLPRHGALGFDNGGSGSRIVWILLGIIGVVAIAMYFGRGADFAQVLDPGSDTPGRAVDVVPLTPGTAPGSGTADTKGVPSSGGGTTSQGSAPAPAPGSAGAASGSAGPASGSPAPASGSAAPASPAAGGAPAGGATSSEAAGASSAAAASPSAVASPGSNGVAGATGASGPAGAGAAASSASGAAAAAPNDAASAPVGGSAPSASKPAQPSASGPVEAPPSAATGASAAPAGVESLVLHFARESWVEVRDATNRVLLLGTQPANSTREVAGQKPYSMTIGNAPFVRVEHGGRNVDLGAVTQKGVARVRVE